jgi:multiple sugar transport system substrate-binding protein
MHRREFLKHGLTLAAGGLISAGLGGFILEGLQGRAATPGTQAPTAVSTSSSTLETTSSSSSGALLADYQDFLDWLRSASGALGPQRSLSISMEAEFAPIALQLRGDDFLQYSGVNDLYDLESYAQQLAAIILMASTESPSYDVFSTDGQNIGVLKDAVISPAELAETYPDLTYPQLNLDEFSTFPWDNVALYPPSLSSTGSPAGASLMLPLDMPLLVLYCRSDVYSRLGMALPKTWDDYYEDVVSISKSGVTPYGVANMASGTVSIVYEFLVHLASFGGKLWETDGDALSPTMNTDEAVAALENYVRFKPYSDPGSSFYTWDDVFSDLSRGIAATGIEWHDYYPWINDPSRSQVTGKMALTFNPSGPSGSFSTFGGSGVGVSSYSKSPEAAWLWLQWATAKGTQETLLLDQYRIYPTREGVLAVQEVADQMAADVGAYSATDLATEIWASSGVTALVGFPKWLSVLPLLSQQLSKAWMGQATPGDALDAAQQGVEALGSLTF